MHQNQQFKLGSCVSLWELSQAGSMIVRWAADSRTSHVQAYLACDTYSVNDATKVASFSRALECARLIEAGIQVIFCILSSYVTTFFFQYVFD